MKKCEYNDKILDVTRKLQVLMYQVLSFYSKPNDTENLVLDFIPGSNY